MTKRSPYDTLPHFADPRYDSYYVPRSKTAEVQRFYDYLLEHGWNYDQKIVEWHAPTSGPENNYGVKGRLCYSMDYTRAWIQPPCFRETSRENPAPGPFFRMDLDEDGRVVGTFLR